jgi:signal transduction histidine kinase
VDPLRLALVGGFALAATACVLSVGRVSTIPNADTQRGFAGLLLLSGTWAGAQVGRLLSPLLDLKIAFYMIGLVTGLASVGAWLYFCSAYTGHDYHRRPVLRQAALATYVGIVGVKLTTPVHGLYFTTSFATRPFPHLVIELEIAHWIVTGLAYALSAIGFYLLYEMFSEVHSDTRTLGALVAVTAVPAVGDVIALVDPGGLPTLNYEPLGVALFAVGVLYVVDEQFVAVPHLWRNQVIETLDDAVVMLGADGTLRDANAAAVETFPTLADATGTPFDETLPELAAALDRGENVVARSRHGRTRYFLLDSTSLTSGSVDLGRVVVCTDITDVERQRRELRRQNDQLDEFAAAITHELRNTLNVVDGYLDLLTASVGGGEPSLDVETTVHRTRQSISRMDRIVGDLSTLARYGQTLDRVDACDLGNAATVAWEEAAPDGPTLDVRSTGYVAADEPRLIEFLRSAFEYAAFSGATHVTVALGADGFTITVDGASIPADRLDETFAYGEAVPSAETGMLFPTMRTLGRVHGWSVDADPTVDGGVRIEVDDVERAESPSGGE